MAVLAGVNWLLDTEGLPWVLEEPTESDLKFLYAGIKFANDERRQRAAVDDSDAGVYEGIDLEKVVSVRLSDMCPHDPRN